MSHAAGTPSPSALAPRWGVRTAALLPQAGCPPSRGVVFCQSCYGAAGEGAGP